MVGGRIEAPCVNRGGWEACVEPHCRTILLVNLVRGIHAQTIACIMHERQQGGTYASLEDAIDATLGLGLEQCLSTIRCGGFPSPQEPQQLQWEAHFLLVTPVLNH